MPFRPADGAEVRQTPPDFSWPWQGQNARYEVRLKGSDGRVATVTTDRNALSWPKALGTGDYEWSVRVVGGRELGPSRKFTVAANAQEFVVPAPAALLKHAAELPHPRFIPSDPAVAADAAARRVIDSARAAAGDTTAEPEPAARGKRDADRGAFARNQRQIKRDGLQAAAKLADAVVAWRLTGDVALRDDARRRLLEVSGWDVEGSSGVDGVHAVASGLAWTMALAYDWLYKDMSAADRQLVRDALLRRVVSLRDEFLADDRMQRKPFNSHGWVTWGQTAAALSLIAGDDPRADELFLDIVPPFITSISPWGGDDGGFGNGLSYGLSAIGALVLPMDIIGDAVGVDLYRKPWVRGMARFATYFLPPGSAEAAFGDAAEVRFPAADAWMIKSLAQRLDDPLAKWHAGKLTAEPADPLPLALGPRAGLLGGTFPGAPNSRLFADIGWAAMHSDLADPARVSVYFMSSPYGSFNHSHASQNAFVIHAGGRALAKSSGYYDFYNSDHWRNWYQATRAHNAITFDGGQGQPQQDMSAAGRIVSWSSSNLADVVVGDATAAYGGALSKDVRTLVYLRPDLVLVHDELASKQARQWEWNLHADNKVDGTDRSMRIQSGDQSLCVDVLKSPAVSFTQTNRFTVEPEKKREGQKFPAQWHASFVSTERSLDAEFVVALRVGCRGPVPAVDRGGDGNWTVEAGSRRVVLGPGRASVQ